MAQQPDWTKIGVIAAGVIGAATVVGEVLPYFYPPDPQHPLRFDFIQNQVSFSVSIGMLMVGFIGVAAISYLIWTIFSRRPTTDLIIRSASYGAGGVSERDVTDQVRRAVKSNGSVAVWIDNNAFGFDPSIGSKKELKVHYSYRTPDIKSVIRPENTLLVLPEDEWLKDLYIQAKDSEAQFQRGLTPLTKEYLAVETDRDNARKLHFEATQALGRTTQELEDARKQLETPKIVLVIIRFDVYEEIAKEQPTQNERLIYGTNNRILIRAHLKISNAHRVETNTHDLKEVMHLHIDGLRSHAEKWIKEQTGT